MDDLFESSVEGKSVLLFYWMHDSQVTLTKLVYKVLHPDQRAKLVSDIDTICDLNELHLSDFQTR